jgi:glycosyltransferase involved in cell wall biosynthesis
MNGIDDMVDGVLVSIITPTYNRAHLLAAAVESVLSQTHRNWELIVIDDGSTDGTTAYLNGLQDGRIKIIETSHCALPSKLRNLGIAAAVGQYVAFLDSDDVWDPTKLAEQLAVLAQTPGARWSYTHVRWVDESGRGRPLPSGRNWKRCEGWIFEQLVTLKAWVATPSVMVERDLLLESRGFDETLRFSEDYDLWLRLACLSPTAVAATPLATIREHSGNTWRTRPVEAMQCWVSVYDRLVTDPTLRWARPTCRRMRANAIASLADRLRQERRYADGVRALIGGLPSGALLLHWWAALAKTALRPFIPASLLRSYQGLRVERS